MSRIFLFMIICYIPYSLGDAIDWKRGKTYCVRSSILMFPYSLGDAIDWKRLAATNGAIRYSFPYSLGDAIDWKPFFAFNPSVGYKSPTR